MIKKRFKTPTLNKKADATRGSEDEMDQGRIMKYLKKTKADREGWRGAEEAPTDGD